MLLAHGALHTVPRSFVEAVRQPDSWLVLESYLSDYAYG
jgi:hypothetical protein